MSGSVVRAVPKQIFDYSGLTTTASSTILGAKGVDVSGMREVNVICRLHAVPNVTGGVTWSGGANVLISARLDAPTTEDPADFTTSTDLASATFTQGTDTPPTVKIFNLVPTNGTNMFGAWLRIYVKGTQGTTAGAAFQAMISVDVNGKS